MSQNQDESKNLDSLMKLQFDLGKTWWGRGVVIKMIIIIGSAILSVCVDGGLFLTFGVMIIGIMTTIVSQHGLKLHSQAGKILRTIERHKALGWKIGNRTRRDLWADVPDKIARAAEKSDNNGVNRDPYWETKEPSLPKRTLGMVQESSWYTAKQSKIIANRLGVACVLISAMSAGALFYLLSLDLNSSTDSGSTDISSTASIILSVFGLVFNGGLYRLWQQYSSFERQCSAIDARCEDRLNSTSISEQQATAMLWDYQLIRDGSPPIPSWVWNRHKSHLEQAWKKSRS